MKFACICHFPEMGENIVKKKKLIRDQKKSTQHIHIYTANSFMLAVIDKELVDMSIGLIHIIDMFHPDVFFHIWLAKSLSNEHIIGDVVLPNVFFYQDHDKEKKALFIERYTTQNDYDFEKFGISVGGICVSTSSIPSDSDTITKMRHTYEADILDTGSFSFVHALQEFLDAPQYYVLKGIYDGRKNPAFEQKNAIEFALQNTLHILDFVINSHTPNT